MYPIHLKFIISGVSGAGKTTLIELLQKISPLIKITVHKKDTTRQLRINEQSNNSLELNFVNQEEFDKNKKTGIYDIVYYRYSNLYGIRHDQLIKAFTEKEVHFIIISDISAIRQLKFMYPDLKAIYVYVDPKTIPEQLQAREGLAPQERLDRIKQSYTEFLENSTLYDHVVLNFWDKENAI